MARRFVTDRLEEWEAGEYTETAALLVSELVSNAVLHARTAATVAIHLSESRLRLEVSDLSPRQPLIRSYGEEATTGRGLGMVVALARRWGVQPTSAGKTVWAELGEAEESAGVHRSDRVVS